MVELQQKELHEDWELVQQVLSSGDEEAFSLLYRRYAKEILSRLYRLLGRPEQARDALQVVFMEAYRSLHSYRGESRLGSWLHRIAERVVVQQHKKEWRNLSIMERWTGRLRQEPELAWADDDPEKEISRQQFRSHVQICLRGLKPAKRTVLLLCDMEGKSYDEAAEIMEISPGTVASCLHHARKELRAMLSDWLTSQDITWKELTGQ
ncbi:MAG: sigma-70 family RNA polymerase sigma factor [Myxococcales bacterium]|nr:sigma-70 family RNA polymerase sigma factor [Myxococcales bacterium]